MNRWTHRRRYGRRRRRLFGLLALAVAVTLTGGMLAMAQGRQESKAVPWEELTDAAAVEPREPEIVPEPPTAKDEPRPQPPEAPTEPQIPAEPDAPYDYTQPVPESAAVDRSWFDDAVFIGDSRTEGLMINTGLTNATFYYHKGLMVSTVFTDPVITLDGKKVSVMEALERTEFSKVYVMFGINEAGWVYTQPFVDKYGEIVDAIREINPDAAIYVQTILPVSREVSDTHPYITNARLDEFNALLREMAAEREVYLVDAAASVAGEDGALPEKAAVDGIHPSKAYCEKWLDYLMTHTV